MHCRYTPTNSHAPRTTNNERPTCNAHDNNPYGTHTGHGGHARTQSLATRLSRRAAGLMLFLVALTTTLSSPAYAQTYYPGDANYKGEGAGARVRLGFELRELTVEQANDIINNRIGGYDRTNRWGDGYIDLWTYAYFDVKTFSKYVTYSEITGKYSWNLIPLLNSMSYVLQKDKAGTTDVDMVNARIAPAKGSGITQAPLADLTYLSSFDYGEPESDLGYGMRSSSSSGKNMDNFDDFVEVIPWEGESFYRVKMYMVRFILKQPGSFYVNFVCNDKKEDWSSGVTNWNIEYSKSGYRTYICPGSAAAPEYDWVMSSGLNLSNINPPCGYPEVMKFIQGGVELISGFEGQITPNPDTVCPGENANLTLEIKRFKNSTTTWANNMTQASVQYKKNGAWSQAVRVGTDGFPYFGDVTNGSAAPTDDNPTKVEFIVPPTWPGTSCDSMRLNLSVIGDGENNATATYRIPFMVRYHEGPRLTAFVGFSASGIWNHDVKVYGKKKGVGGDKDTIVGVSGNGMVCAVPANEYLNSPLNKPKILTTGGEKETAFKTAYDENPFLVVETRLMYAADLSTDFEEVAGTNTDYSERTEDVTLKQGYYYIEYKSKKNKEIGCTYVTDTVFVRVLAVPILTITTGAECDNTGMKVEATATDGQVKGWEWILGQPDELSKDGEDIEYYVPLDNPRSKGPWVRIPDGVTFDAGGGGWPGLEGGGVIKFSTSHEGQVGRLELTDINDVALEWLEKKSIPCWDTKEPESDGFWPAETEENKAQNIKFSDSYSVQYFKEKVFYARYWVGEDTSAWGSIMDYCKESFPVAMGVSATTCWSNNFQYRGTCEGTNTEVSVGDDVTLRCYLEYGDENESLENEHLSEYNITVYWQVSTDNGATWTTWHVSGFGNPEDDGECKIEEWGNGEPKGSENYMSIYSLFIEAKRKNITKTEQHRAYAVFGTCEYHPWEDCNKIYYGISCNPEGDMGDYDTKVTITVGAKLEIAKTGDPIDKKEVDICDGDKIDIALTGITVPDGTNLTWEQFIDEDFGGWYPAVGFPASANSTTTVKGITPWVRSVDEDVFKEGILGSDGVVIQYRVKIDGVEDPIGYVSVTVRKAPEYKVSATNEKGDTKSAEAGYCAGETITIRPVNDDGSPADASLIYAYQQVADIGDFMAPAGSEFLHKLNERYADGSGAGYHRIVVSSNGCYGYSDTVQVVIRDPFTVTLSPSTTTTVCAGGNTSVTLTATDVANVGPTEYRWFFDGTRDNAVTGSTATKTYPIPANKALPATNTVSVDLLKIFGSTAANPKREDTVHCYSPRATATITVVDTPNISAAQLTITPGETVCKDVEDDVIVKLANVNTTGLTWEYTWTLNDAPLAGTTTSTTSFTVPRTSDGDVDPAYLGTYKVQVVATNTSTNCSSTKTLTKTLALHPAPALPAVSFKPVSGDTVFCENIGGNISATFTPATPASSDEEYAIMWFECAADGTGINENNSLGTTNTLSITGDRLPTATGDAGARYFCIQYGTHNTTSECWTISDYTSPIKVTTQSCSEPKIENLTYCDEDKAGKSFTLTCPPNVTGVTFTLSDGTTVAGSINPTPASGNQSYTLTPDAGTLPAAGAITAYKVTVTMPGVATNTLNPTFTVRPKPDFTVSVTGDDVCPKFTATLKATAMANTGSSIKNLTYKWQHDVGTVWSTGSSNTISFKAISDSNGTYTAFVTAESADGCKNEKNGSKVFTMKSLPDDPEIPEITDTMFCSNQDYSFALPPANTTDVSGYKWEYSTTSTTSGFQEVNGATTSTLSLCKNSSTACNNGIIMAASGNLNLRLIVSSSKDGCTRADTSKVVLGTIASAPTVAPTGNNVTVCSGTDTTLSINYTPDVNETATYLWKVGNNPAPGTNNQATYKVTGASATTTYTVEVTTTNTATNCSNTGTATVVMTVKTKPSVGTVTVASDPDGDYCTKNNKTDNKITLTATANGSATDSEVSYKWFKGVGTAPIQSGSSNKFEKTPFTTADAGTYKARVIYTKDICVDSAESTVTIAVTETPVITEAKIEPSTKEICAGNPFEFTASVQQGGSTNATITSYQWKKGGDDLGTGVKYSWPEDVSPTTAPAAGSHTYSVVITVERKTPGNKYCKATDTPTATLTVIALPDLGSVEVASDPADGKGCEKVTLTATAKNAAGTAINSGVTYQWQERDATGTGWADIVSATDKTYEINTPVADKEYRCVASMGVAGSDCGKSEESSPIEVTVYAKPVISSVTVSPATATICKDGTAPTFTVAVDPTPASAGTYSYAWKQGSTSTPLNTTDGVSADGLSFTPADVATADTRNYTVTVTATNGKCSVSKDGPATFTVTTPVDLSGITIKDTKTDTCISASNTHTLSVNLPNLPTGAALSYTWTKPDGTTDNSSTLTVPSALENSGTYKVDLVESQGASDNPCTSSGSATFNLRFNFCGEEPLAPGTGQATNIAMICANERDTDGSWVGYTPADDKEPAAVTKVTWYKKADAFGTNTGITGGQQIGSPITITAPYTWPLKLTQQDVFGSETVPKHYYVRARIERTKNGVVSVTYSNTYRFALVENAPKITTLTITPTNDTICLGSGANPSTTESFTASNTTTLTAPTTGYSGWVTPKLEGVTGISYIWKWNTETGYTPNGSPRNVPITGEVSKLPMNVKAVSGYVYTVGSTEKVCRDTSEEKTGYVTTTLPPDITSFTDNDNKTSKTLCTNTAESAYPTLTVVVPDGRGTVVKWEKKEGSGAYTDMGLAEGTLSHKLTAADVATLPTAGAADKKFTYRVTVKHGTKCPAVEKEYELTFVSMPALTGVDITGRSSEPEFEFCNTGTLTATPKNGNAAYSGTPTPTYCWEKSATGAENSFVPTGTTLASESLTVSDSGYYYRCVATVTKTGGTAPNTVSCPVSVTTPVKQVTVSASSNAGTSSIDDLAICSVGQTTKFNVTGKTGNITKIEISTANNFPVDASTVTVNAPDGGSVSVPYTINPQSTDPNIKGLLDASSSRMVTLYVRATVRSGGVCDALPGTARSVVVYKPHDGISYTLPTTPLCEATNVTYTPAISGGNNGFEEIVWTIKKGTDIISTSPSSASTGRINPVGIEPKWEQDTTYTLAAVVNNTKVDGGCDGIAAESKDFKVSRKPVAPVVSAAVTVCEGGDYEVWANRPAKAQLSWSLTKDGAVATCGTPVPSGQKETISVTGAQKGTYQYTATDQTTCGDQSSTIDVTVKERAVANTITLANNGLYCAANDVSFTASNYRPTGATIQWQVSTDTTNASATVNKGTGATHKPSGITAGTQYFARYVVKGDAPCGDSASKWVPFKIFESPQISGVSVTDKVCEGGDITISFTAAEGYTYALYSNSSNATTGGTPLATGSGTVPAGGHVSCTTSAVYGKGHFYVVVTDPNGGGVSCATKTQYLGATDIDQKVTAGDLAFTAPQAGDVIDAKVGQTVTLKITGGTTPTGSTSKIMWVSAKGTTPPAYASAQALSGLTQQLTTANQDTTHYWRVVTSRLGLCPAAYSDTVKVFVELGDKPTLEINSPICHGSDIELTVSNIQDEWKDKFQWGQLQWQYRAKGASTWEDITLAEPDNTTGKVTYSPSSALDPGEYEFRYQYVIAPNDPVWIEDPATLQVDAPSVGGHLWATDTVICVGGTQPVIHLANSLGTVTGLYFGKPAYTNINFSAAVGGTDTSSLYNVPTTNTNMSGWYQAKVKNGVCDEVKSDSLFIRVVEKPVAGTLSQETLCYDNGTKTVQYTSGTGNLLTWQTASTENGSYTTITPTTPTSYEVGPRTDHLWVKVIVNTNAVCAADTVKQEVKVYDTLKITAQPQNKTVTGTNQTATFTVTVATAGLKYADNSNTLEPVAAGTHAWQYSTDGGNTWNNLPRTNHTASNGTLKVNKAEDYEGNLYRCIITSNPCSRSITSAPATIKANAQLVPGHTESRTECDCYYPTDSVIYFVEDAAGEGRLTYRWQISEQENPDPTNTAHWIDLEKVSELEGKYELDSNRIVFKQMQDLDEAHAKWIRAWVKDEASPEAPTTGDLVKICRQPKPTYTFKGAIVCERDGAGDEVKFEYTAIPNHISGRSITYAYALHADPTNFTEINTPSGSDVNVTVGWDDNKKLTLRVKAADTSLVIPAASAIPFEADSLIIRMEVRSCYTPAPLATNTDTTIYAVLRVDKAPEITLLRDTIVCKGSDVTLTARAVAANTTIPGNEISMQITPGGQLYTQPIEAVSTWDMHISNIQQNATYTAKAKTSYCPEKTSTATITVKEIPVLTGMRTEPVCLGGTLSFEAFVTNYDASTCQIRWLRKNGSEWDTLSSDLTYTKSDVTAKDAGEYALLMRVTVPSCATEVLQPFTFKVWVTPEIVLTPSGNVLVVKTKTATVTAKPKTLAEMGYSADLIPYLYLVEPSDYEWYIQKNGAGLFEKLTGSNHTSLINSAVNGSTLTFVGVEGYDSTLFYVKAITDCENVETKKDTLRLTDKFAVTDVTISPDPACEGENVTIVARTTAPAVYVEWQVSTDGGDTWTRISIPSDTYETTGADGSYTLTVKNVKANMEGYMYRVLVREGEGTEDVYSTEKDGGNFTGHPVELHVDKPVKFICNDVFRPHEPAIAVGGSPDNSKFEFITNCMEGCVTCKSAIGEIHRCEEDLQYFYEVRGRENWTLNYNSSGADYTFTPVLDDTGRNAILFRVGNHCGFDTVYDTVMVIAKPEPGVVTAIPTKPGKGPDDPIAEDVEGPKAEDITVEICEGNTLYLAATYTGGPASGFHWEMDDNTRVPMTDPYSLRGDTLVISPVSDTIHNKTYHCVFEMPGTVADITSQDITVHVNHKPDGSSVHVAIWDMNAEPKLDTGQALPGHKVTLTIEEDVPDGTTKVCYYQAFKNAEGEVDSVELLGCYEDGVYEHVLTELATVADHDATWYYAQIYNECGYDSTNIYQLRIFDTLTIRWIPDTLIEHPGKEFDIDTLYPDPEPGKVLVIFRPDEDSTQVEAHLWVCQNAAMLIRDTTLTGFMSPEVYSEYEESEDPEEQPERGSRWYYRESEDDEWKVISLRKEPWVLMLDLGGVDLTVQEHEGNVGFRLPADPNMDGWQFKAWGMNALYDDSSCVLTLHVIPVLEHGDLVMNPAELCATPGAEFRLSSDKDLSKLTIDWQVKTEGSDAWSENIELLHDSTSYKLDGEGLPLNVRQVRAIAMGACGGDTVYGIIKTPVAPGVKLLSDSVCLGESLLLTAVDTGDAGHSAFAWYVNDELVEGATGETFDMSAYPAGHYTVRVVMTADLTTNGGCVLPHTAQAEQVAEIYALPQIKAYIADTLMKNIDTTSVWAKGQSGYTYQWSPETGLFDATSDSTSLSGLEPQEEPYWYVVTATDENGCQTKDSVHVRIESNFTIDSFSIRTIVPPVLDLDGGELPGYPTEPEDSYYAELGGASFGGEIIFRNDTLADLWICAHNTALVHFNVRGGEKPITYTWTIDDGNATLVYPVDAREGSPYSFIEPDSVFGVFFPDTTTHIMYCDIKDKTGVGGKVTIRVHYYRPEMFYLEVTPKVTSGKYYEQQAINFFVRPDRDWLTTWIEIRNGKADTVTNRNMNRQASFTKEEGDNTSIWISTVDRHGCRIWDSVPIHIIPLPNVLLMGDPMNGVLFPEFEVEITNSWGLKVKAFEDRNGNGTSRGWDGRTKSGTFVVAGTYYYRVKIPTLDKQGYMIVNGAVTVVNK